MRNIYISITLLCLTVGFYVWATSIAQDPAQDKEYIQAVNRMYQNWMTKYSDWNSFNPHGRVLREQAAKFLSEYSSKIEFKVMNTARYCEFKDLETADKTLKNSIIESCLLNIFYGTQGMFYPTRPLSKAEALVTIIRVSEGKLPETDEAIWRKSYTKRAKQLWLSKESDPVAQDRPITRYEIALLLYRASKLK